MNLRNFSDSGSDSEANLESIGPWRRLDSRTIYDNAWIRLREDRVIHPHGEEGIYGVVEFKHIAVGVIAVDEKEQVYLVGQHRYPSNYYSWEIPEGGCKPNEESPLGAAKRELKEESGIVAKEWNYLGCFALSNSVSNEIAHIFLARGLTIESAEPEATEVLQSKVLPFSEACRRVLEGEINESITVVGLLRAQHYLLREKQGMSPITFADLP